MDRESNFSYRAVGAGTYFGAYQMNRGLAIGATRTMEPEVRSEMGAEGVKILRSLRSIAPNRWNRYWQDRAFYTIWRNGIGQGPLARRRASLLLAAAPRVPLAV